MTVRGRNLVAQANVLSASVGRWQKRIAREDARLTEGALDVRFALGGSAFLMRLTLRENEPFLRVDLAAHWRERRTTLRSEHWLALDTRDAVTNERYARATASDGTGVAIFTAESCAWRVRKLKRGGIHFATTLLRGRGLLRPATIIDASFAFAYAPYEHAPTSAIERAWDAFVHPNRVALFESDDEAVIVTATKPTPEGDGVIVSVGECDGAARRVRLRCAGRAKGATSEVVGEVGLEDGALVFPIDPHAQRSFRVLF